ncbi:DNA-directed RNA polymerase III subunit RPC6 [Thelohanellus kitauei]|uniref:DNA-directed RNA polymerase III subunit RPC6 n=1 Tax=Thelohanellus kitauei TaxID=669202 RepID=A0A0C2I7Y2_THEKT|nr:DNA-directed RNA polymerase III subunit RPC6 [Thelohanellus kitauei]
MERNSIEKQLLLLCQNNKEGLTAEDIVSKIDGLSAPKFVEVVNKLSIKGIIEPFIENGKLTYRCKYKPQPNIVSELGSRPKLSDENELRIYRVIEESGSKGLTIRDIKGSLGLTIPTIKKILSIIDKKGYIKSYFPVHAQETANAKLYVSTAFTPNTSITGGSLYQNMEIESNYVNELMAEIIVFMNAKNGCPPVEDLLSRHNHGLATGQEIYQHLLDRGASTNKLTYKELEQVLEAMIYDGSIQRQKISKGLNSEEMYKAAFESEKTIKFGISAAPCAKCKV